MLKKIFLIFAFALAVGNTAHAADDKQTTVYYFHGNQRCYTCNKMENFTKEAVSASFKDNKNIAFKAVNTDEPENKHFVKDYSLYTKSVILVDDKGNWKNLDKIWTLVRNEKDFKDYIVQGVNDFIGGAK